ncbi:MAG: hypothetical protein MUD14_29120 [Hydrococcus sp. Prado102]|nr:hypothetical protein [Hydrococcus sp. Prado102]
MTVEKLETNGNEVKASDQASDSAKTSTRAKKTAKEIAISIAAQTKAKCFKGHWSANLISCFCCSWNVVVGFYQDTVTEPRASRQSLRKGSIRSLP